MSVQCYVQRGDVIRGDEPGKRARFGSMQFPSWCSTQLFNAAIPTFKDAELVPCTVLMQWTPDWPFLARTTLSLAERNMYFVPPTVTPFIASWSVLEYLSNQVLLAYFW